MPPFIRPAIAKRRFRVPAGVWIQGIVFATLAHDTLADVPQVQRIFPQGGMLGQSVDVELKGKLTNDELHVWSSRPGLTWERQQERGKFRVTVEPNAEPGLYLIRFHDVHGATSLHRFVVGSTPEINEREPNNRIGDSQSVETTPLVVNGVLEKRDDVDLYSLQLKADSTLVASIDAERSLKSPVDVCLQIVDAKGNVLAMNLDYHGLDPHLTWNVPRDGLYSIRVFGFPSAPDSTIRLAGSENFVYRLTLTTGPYLEATLPLAVSSAELTVLQPQGWNLAAKSDPLTVQPITAANGTHVVSHWISIDGASGSLSVPVVDCPIYIAPVHSRETPPSTNVTIPSSITGSLSEPEAEDVFVFKMTKGERITATIESRSLGYPLDAVLQIQSIAGKRLAREDDTKTGRDPVMRWTAPEDGEYRIVVSEVNRMAAPHSYYRLSLAHEKPSFTVTVTGDLFTAKVNEPLSMSFVITRQNGFDGRLTLKLVDPPQGLTAEPVTSEPKGDTAKELKWTITAAQPFNGPIRIAVNSEGGESGGSLPSSVRATESQTADLWLVALP